MNSREADATADAGRLPFAETDRTGRGRLAPIFESPTPTEHEIEALVVRCLAPDPSQRVPSSRALRDALESGRAGLG